MDDQVNEVIDESASNTKGMIEDYYCGLITLDELEHELLKEAAQLYFWIRDREEPEKGEIR